jgi:hypothetical protein
MRGGQPITYVSFHKPLLLRSKAVDWIQGPVVPALVKLEKNNAMFANIGG